MANKTWTDEKERKPQKAQSLLTKREEQLLNRDLAVRDCIVRADERAKTLKEVYDKFEHATGWTEMFKWLEAELKKVEKVTK